MSVFYHFICPVNIHGHGKGKIIEIFLLEKKANIFQIWGQLGPKGAHAL